ncbi:MBL fold metallo-hydrolase [Thermoleptolyngbya sp. C42_A2020_037]|uniref:MBL fold metallo-hydrolase n=1 Tax=Thermoleptolyngbya sp. C42_A2020_037 TaxID=2747799 RepID=UPI001A0C93B2|nr:MBL fold metallo-hydrolase [Thermoleptolyngbya sp. C42_A2020_037]MBF2084855.1 MBL fold metallo-hydrolase [Thermoleptolyngbya sp. C42_A2020_037]
MQIDPQTFTVKFWGVRGSVPTPGVEMVRYGGNTPCVEMQVAGQRIIFDGGTGLRLLGKHLRDEMPVEAHLFFTHTHWDRIQGFPFFAPAFVSGNCFYIYGAAGPNGASIKQRLSDQMLRPNFPVPLQVMQADLKFVDIVPGSVIPVEDVTVEAVSLNRPNGALGYRVTWGGYSVVYATDTERSPDSVEQNLKYLAQDADLLIYDAAYISDHALVDPEAATGEQNHGWQSGIDLAIAARVKQVIMFHHDPAHEDDFLDSIEQDVQSRYPNVKLAREGMVLDVTRFGNNLSA